MKKCLICGRFLKKDYQEEVCKHCIETKGLSKCSDCDEWKSDYNTTKDNRVVCDECIQDYVFCDICQEYYKNDYVIWIEKDEKSVCKDCLKENFVKCNDCDEWTNTNNMYTTANDNPICEDCYDNNYFVCDDCGDIYHNDYRNFIGDECFCNGCAEERRGAILEHDANAKDILGFYDDYAQDKLFFGVELETIDRERKTEDIIKEYEDFLIAKTDGSLPSNGVEFNTAPATFETQVKKWDKILDSLKEHKFISYDEESTGIHIHLSKSAIDQQTIDSMLFFINKEENQGFLEKIAQRKACRWCEYAGMKKKKEVKEHKDNFSNDKYKALNIAPQYTIELRIFKGTIFKTSFMKNLEFANSLVMFCKNRTGEKQLSKDSFIKFLFKNKGVNENLINFLIKKGEVGSCA